MSFIPKTVSARVLSISRVKQAAADGKKPKGRAYDVVMATGEVVTDYCGSRSRYQHQLALDGTVRLERMNSGRAPVIDSHGAYSAGGVLGLVAADSAAVTEGGLTGRIQLMADDKLPEPIRNGLEQGVIQNLSVQATVHAAERIESEATELLRITDWEPFELSLVAAGADSGARLMKIAQSIHGPHLDADGGGGGGAGAQQPSADDIRKAERERIAGVTTVCQGLGVDPQPFIDGGQSVDYVKQNVVLNGTTTVTQLRAQAANAATGPVDAVAVAKAERERIAAIQQVCGHPIAQGIDPQPFIDSGASAADVRTDIMNRTATSADGFTQARQTTDGTTQARLATSIANAFVLRGDPHGTIAKHEGSTVKSDHGGISMKEAGRLLLMESGMLPRAAVAQMYSERTVVDAIMQHGVQVRQSPFLTGGLLRIGDLTGNDVLGAQAVAQAVGGITGDLLGAQGGSDLSVVVENVMHRMLNAAYSGAADTFTYEGWTDMIMANDFRPHQHVMMGATPNLGKRVETGDFPRALVPNPEKATTQVEELGNVIVIDRITIVNDDLGVLMRTTSNNAIAARRTQDDACYGLLKEGAGLGPNLDVTGTSTRLYNGDNVVAGAAISATSFNADQVAMARLKAHGGGGNAFGGYKADTVVLPVELNASARIIRDSEKEPGTDNQNIMFKQFERIIPTPRLTGTRRYWFSMGLSGGVMATPICRSYYGSQTPYLAMAESFTTRGGVWIVALDFGVDAINHRGTVTNAGA